MKSALAILVASCGLAAFASPAEAKPAKCDISSDGERYAGPCDFTAKKGGSFQIVLPQEASEQIVSSYLILKIVSPGQAQLSGSVWGRGQVSNWGAVSRDAKRPACWSGEWGRGEAPCAAFNSRIVVGFLDRLIVLSPSLIGWLGLLGVAAGIHSGHDVGTSRGRTA